MAVHVFPVESLSEKELSMERAYSNIRKYLGIRNQRGQTASRPMHCTDVDALNNAIKRFIAWSGRLPQDDPKLLWMRLHGEEPVNKQHVGTRGVSSKNEFFNWWKVFSGFCGKFPRNVVVVMDVCWGASPAAPAMMSGKTGNPRLLFGSVRAAYPFELETAIGLVVGALARGAVPTLAGARGVVRALNRVFPSDPKNDKPFYRVCWWTKRSTRPNCFPANKGPRLTRVSP